MKIVCLSCAPNKIIVRWTIIFNSNILLVASFRLGKLEKNLLGMFLGNNCHFRFLLIGILIIFIDIFYFL